MNAPSPAQLRVLDYVRQHVATRGVFPSGPQIARRLGLRNPASVYEILERLAKKGYLVVHGGGPRPKDAKQRTRRRYSLPLSS